MSKDETHEGLKNWGRGPSSGRPDSVGSHNIMEDPNDPGAKGLDPNKDYKGGGAGNGPNTGLGITGKPGGPVNIQPKK
jgi:hypothetical protein